MDDTLTPGGWTHEQSNTKGLSKPDGTQVELVREFGFNDCRKTAEVNFKPAYEYRKATQGHWAKVRERRDDFLSRAPGVRLKTKIDGMAMIMPLLEHADDEQAGKAVNDARIDAVFAQRAEPAPATD